MTVPYSFSTATSAIPLSQLDSNFNTPITLGNTAIQLGNTVTTLNNMTLANVTVSSGTITLTDITASGNVTLSGGTANGVAYLNGSKVVTTGSALTFDGTNFATTGTITSGGSYNFNTTSGRDILWGTGSYTYITGNPGTGVMAFGIANSEQMRLTSTGLGIGLGGGSPNGKLQVKTGTNQNLVISTQGGELSFEVANDAYSANTPVRYYATNHTWYVGANTMTLDASGNLLVGTTSQAINEKLNVTTGNTTGCVIKNTGGATYTPIYLWNATTTGDSFFSAFVTETAATVRGSITYNRGGGVVAYNTTSDYRAKDIIGPLENSGALIDSVPVYMGKMHGATQERPMFIAHETPAYAHTGKKDAVDEEGNPIYQQMDASSLIPVMWAELQSLRKRVAQLEGK